MDADSEPLHVEQRVLLLIFHVESLQLHRVEEADADAVKSELGANDGLQLTHGNIGSFFL